MQGGGDSNRLHLNSLLRHVRDADKQAVQQGAQCGKVGVRLRRELLSWLIKIRAEHKDNNEMPNRMVSCRKAFGGANFGTTRRHHTVLAGPEMARQVLVRQLRRAAAAPMPATKLSNMDACVCDLIHINM